MSGYLTVLSISPVNGALNVQVNDEIFGLFSEEIDCDSVSDATFTLSPSVDAAVYVDPLDPKKIVLSPDSELQRNKTYIVTFTTGIKGKSGNALATNYSWRFTTATYAILADMVSPSASFIAPSDKATDIPVSTNIKIIFSKRIQSSTINHANIQLLNNVMAEVLRDVTLSRDRKTVIINPINPLEHSRTYTVRITAGVKDLVGNSITQKDWLFTTTAPTHPEYTNYDEEWKMCRSTTDKFDATLLDLRKYGFTIITGLITAGAFLGFSQPTKVIQLGVIIVSMVLVVILYWLDIYYMNLLFGSVFRTRFLEIFKLNRALSIYISAFYGSTRIGDLLHFLYGGFLTGLFVLGLYVVSVAEGAGTVTFGIRSVSLGLFIGYAVSISGILLIYILCDRVRTHTVVALSRKFKDKLDKKNDPAEVTKLEKEIMEMFKNYL